MGFRRTTSSSRSDADGASVFRRLDAGALKEWLEDYSLGELWKMNVVGGESDAVIEGRRRRRGANRADICS